MKPGTPRKPVDTLKADSPVSGLESGQLLLTFTIEPFRQAVLTAPFNRVGAATRPAPDDKSKMPRNPRPASLL